MGFEEVLPSFDPQEQGCSKKIQEPQGKIIVQKKVSINDID